MKGFFEQSKSPFAFLDLHNQLGVVLQDRINEFSTTYGHKYIRRLFGKVTGSICLHCGLVIAYSFADRGLDIAEAAHARTCHLPAEKAL